MCLGDGQTVKAFGRGSIYFTMVFKMSNPKKVTMNNALYVAGLTCNLFSVRASVAKGNKAKFGETECWVHDKNEKLLGMGSLVDKLYYLDYTTVTQECVATALRLQIGNKADIGISG